MSAAGEIRVRKFGGTSVGTPERIRSVARRLVEDQKRGLSQVVVVSAMAKTTDQLVELALQVSRKPSRRELDMLLTTGEQVSIALLAMAVHELNVNAISLTGAQCGILTDGNFSRAKIQNIDTVRIRSALEQGQIVIVAGFQGITSEQEITTLGRGGSDTTATALAAALQAPVCEIYTDVDGVFTADPRVVPEARLLEWIGYDEMLEYAASGSRVLHPRCVEIARKFGVALQVRSSFHTQPGTLVVKEEELENVAITGVTGDSAIARVALTQVRDVPGIAARVSRSLAEVGISISLIIQGIRHDQTNDISLIIAEADAERAKDVLSRIVEEVGAAQVLVDTSVAKVSIIGSGVASNVGVAARLFESLARVQVNIELISSSEVRIACIIQQDRLDDAIRAIHDEFDLSHLERNRLEPSN